MKQFLSWFKVIVWAALIFFFSSIPNLKSNLEEDFILRKIAHVTEYAILMYLLLMAFKDSYKTHVKVIVTFSLLLAMSYAMSDEIHQHFVPGRHGCWQDVVIDAIGIIGVAIFWVKKYKFD